MAEMSNREKQKDLILIGTGGTALRIMSFVQAHNLYRVVGFAVNEAYLKETEFAGLPVYALERLSEEQTRDCAFFIAVQWNYLNAQRRKMYEDACARGLRLVNLISPMSVVCAATLEGTNCWIQDFVVLQRGVRIGANTFVAAGAWVGNDTVVGPHVFIGAHASVCGKCVIGEQTFVGVNATVFPGSNVGRKCIVGAGAVVRRNVPDFTRCSVAPEALVQKQYSEDVIESKLVSGRNVH